MSTNNVSSTGKTTVSQSLQRFMKRRGIRHLLFWRDHLTGLVTVVHRATGTRFGQLDEARRVFRLEGGEALRCHSKHRLAEIIRQRTSRE